MSPQANLSLTVSPDNATTGWTWGAQGSAGPVTGQYGGSRGGGGDFREAGIGIGSPGISLTGYYVSPGWCPWC